jgi:tRNA(fMet)-specific endonuclease VapC
LRYLLDTNIISEPFKLQPDPNVLAKLQEHAGEIAIASVTWHELKYGFHRMPESRRKQQLNTYLSQTVHPNLPILPYDEQAAEWFAAQRARLMELGQTPSFPDGQIAAIAHRNNLVLVTRNVSDYKNFTTLQIENWFSEG